MKQTLNLEQKALKFTELKALNEQELRETEGGIWPAIGAVAAACAATIAVGLLVGEAYYYVTH